ncbi:unnamed protein product [Malus baccata var. baccata]
MLKLCSDFWRQSALIVEKDSGIALHYFQMSESGSPSDEGSPNSNSRFELAMLKSSRPLLESCTKNSRLGDFRNCQTLANIGSSSFMSVGEGVVYDAIPIFRSEFTADHLVKNMLDSERLGEPSFHQWRYCYKMRPVKACTGYNECTCRMTRGTIKLSRWELADVEKVLRVPKENRHLVEKMGKKWETSAKKGKAPMLVPIDDILFHKRARKHRVKPALKPKSQEEVFKIAASKKAEAEAIGCVAAIVAGEERRLLPPLPTINPIFPPNMESTNQEGDPSSSRKRKYKEEVGNIHWKDLKVAIQPRHRSTIDELGEPLDENKSDRDWMMRLSSYVMTEYDDRLQEVERYKAKFKENKQLVNDARKMSKALADAIRLKDQNFESLKKRNGENVRLKKQLEATKKQLETTILDVFKVKGELDSALVEVSRLKMSIPTERDVAVQKFLGSQAFHDAFRPHCIRAANFEKRKWMAYRDEMDEYRQKGEAFVLAVDPSSDDDSDNEASIDEQSQESGDDPGHAEECGDDDGVETHSDIVKGSASDEDDSYCPLFLHVHWMYEFVVCVACAMYSGYTSLLFV